jgi:Sec-independent protein translocase protein TatA
MIPGIGSIGGAEPVIPFVIILFFGAKRLPQIGRSFEIGVKELRREAAGLSDEDEAERQPRNKDRKEIAPGVGRGEGSV